MQVLVTGANGLLGANLTRQLLADGVRVRTLVRAHSDTRGLDGLEVERVVGDVRDAKTVRDAVAGCELVFHAAAVFSYWGYSRGEMMDTARSGTGIVIRAARDAKVRRVVLTSTAAVLGGSGEPRALGADAEVVEGHGPDYFRSKAVQERFAVDSARELGVDLVVVNPSVFVGPHDYRPSQSAQAFTGYLRDPLKITYAGGVSLAHVEDVARGHILAAANAEPYRRHLLAGENIRWSTLHELLASLGSGPKPRLRVGRRMAMIAGALMELGAWMSGRPPLATRALAGQIGRFFWYDSAPMEAFGYAYRDARSTLRDTLSWWARSPHVSAREASAWMPKG